MSFNNLNTLRNYNDFYLCHNERRKRIRIKIIIFIFNYNNTRQLTYINYFFFIFFYVFGYFFRFFLLQFVVCLTVQPLLPN